ncbi:hypothetical protein FRB94_002384 [Tulasnella sp. JGI-2019a]|nr:hypothetical protein FRB94_002384 [Tulasnella sp. JGI-2019a]
MGHPHEVITGASFSTRTAPYRASTFPRGASSQRVVRGPQPKRIQVSSQAKKMDDDDECTSTEDEGSPPPWLKMRLRPTVTEKFMSPSELAKAYGMKIRDFAYEKLDALPPITSSPSSTVIDSQEAKPVLEQSEGSAICTLHTFYSAHLFHPQCSPSTTPPGSPRSVAIAAPLNRMSSIPRALKDNTRPIGQSYPSELPDSRTKRKRQVTEDGIGGVSEKGKGQRKGLMPTTKGITRNASIIAPAPPGSSQHVQSNPVKRQRLNKNATVLF